MENLKCAGAMNIIAFIECIGADSEDTVLEHVGLRELKSRLPLRAGPSTEDLQIDHSESQVVYSGDYCDSD